MIGGNKTLFGASTLGCFKHWKLWPTSAIGRWTPNCGLRRAGRRYSRGGRDRER